MKRLTLLLMAALTLTGCAALQSSVGDGVEAAVTAIGKGDDGATLTASQDSVLFVPAGEVSGVALTVTGDAVTAAAPCVRVAPDAAKCITQEAVSVPVAFPVTCLGGCVYWISYYAGDTLRTFYVRY